MKRAALVLLCFNFLLLSACVKDKPQPQNTEISNSSGRKIWVANEGSLGNGNASLSFILPDKDSIYNNIFEGKNNQSLGDVFESMLLVGNRLFMAINNSDKIQIIDKDNFTSLGTISVQKPRYMVVVDSHKMYVSSLFYADINIVDPTTLQVTGSIQTDYPNTEGLLVFNQKVYACNWDTACNYLYEINPENNQIVKRIFIAGYAPQQVLADKEGKLWVLAGNTEKGKPATLTRIDPVSGSILQSFHFPAAADVMKPCWNAGKDTLYFLEVNYNGGTSNNGVFRMDIHAQTLPANPLVQAKSLQYFWALGVDSTTGKIYVGDPKGFIQRGSVLVYDNNGNLLQTYAAELGPGFFLFEKK